MSYAQGFSQLSFEAIRLLQHCKGLFLCSFIYGAQTFSDLEIWEKAISCPQRKRLRLLPLGRGEMCPCCVSRSLHWCMIISPAKVPLGLASTGVHLWRYLLENKHGSGARAATRGSPATVGADPHQHPKVLGVHHPSRGLRVFARWCQACSPAGLQAKCVPAGPAGPLPEPSPATTSDKKP